MAKIIVHRGAKQIGGVSVEISTAGSKVFIDFGENLPGIDTQAPEIEGLTFGDSKNSALFLTHYHGDHIGRLSEVLPEVPVYMGETAKAIQMNYIERTRKNNLPLFERISTFNPLDCIAIGDITVTPLMIDHSAFDAYMFVIEADGKRILHTGDFRLHGMRGGKTLKMLRCYARNIDYIVCEGTTISRDGEPQKSEHQLIKDAAEMMKDEKYVFALCSTTNIDRIGVFYHANPRGRMFVCDPYQKKQLETVSQRHAGKSDFYDFEYARSYRKSLDTAMEKHGFCMLVRQGNYFKQIMDRFMKKNRATHISIVSEHRLGGNSSITNVKYENCLVIYSMWTGYLDERAKSQGLVDFLAPYRYKVLHTSGHASPEDIQKLYETVKPSKGLIPMHTDAPERFYDIIPESKLILPTDGAILEI